MIRVARHTDPWSLFDELMSLRGDFNRIVEEGFRGDRRSGFPQMNVWASESDLVADLEVPGIDPKAIEISVLGDELTIAGERKGCDADEDSYLRRERFSGRFERTLALPFRVDGDKVAANYSNGVLRITLPRAEVDKPKRIEVKAG